MTEAERRERARLRWRRAHGIMPRRPAQKPWLAMGVSRSTYYRRRAKARRYVALARNPEYIKRQDVADLLTASCARAEAFTRQRQAEVARCQAVTAAIIGELASFRA